MADKADWSDANVRHFIDICIREIEAGNRPLGFFNRTGWINIVSKIEEKTGMKLTKKQLKNKWDNMKKEFTWFMEFKNCATGLGWNEAKQTVDCSNEWWDEHLARCNNPERGVKCNHVRFRKQGPKYLDDMHILFDKIHVTGASATCPGDISSSDSSEDHVFEVQPELVKLAALKKSKLEKKKRKGSCTATEGKGEKGENSPFYRLYKNTCLRIETASGKISSSVEASSAASPISLVPTIAQAMKMVKDCGVEEKTALMHTATFLIMKPEFREVLSSFETNEGRLDLLQREHEKDSMKRL